jgi:hypothetical protein
MFTLSAWLRWQVGRPRWRALAGVPFVLSLLLTLAFGSATIDSQYLSSWELATASLLAFVLIVAAPPPLLFPGAAATFLVSPLMLGVGLYRTPAWATAMVAVCFYGSILASAAVLVVGFFLLVRRLVSGSRRAVVVRAAVSVLSGGTLVALIAAAPAATAAPADSTGNMGRVINTSHREAEPSFTSSGRTMYFNCNDEDICMTQLAGTWADGRWTTPRIVGEPISSPYIDVEPVISPDGRNLYITSNRPFGSGDGMPGLSMYVDVLWAVGYMITDRLGISLFGGLGHDRVWVSHQLGGVWSAPEDVNQVPGEPHVNGPFNDHCLFVSPDGTEAFWTSDRPGGFGVNDIWTSRLVDGKWTTPENLGHDANSVANEHHAMLSPDRQSLYVTSDRPGGLGGDDIYVTTRGGDGRWGPLVNLGSPVNGPGNDRCPVLTPDGKVLLFDSDRASGYGNKDIWWIDFHDLSR